MALGASLVVGTLCHAASVNTVVVLPEDVPDETEPRVDLADSPAGFGEDSWQGPATNKTNWHARYLADGDALSALFPADAAGLTIGDLASLSYYTKRPSSTPAGRDWWIQIYTRPQDPGDWYDLKFTNNYNDHSETDDWTLYSTDNAAAPTAMMTFNLSGSSTEMSLSDLQTSYGSDLIEMISIQTDSGWNGFDGFMDGLTIELTNGNVGRVNFEAVPTPGAATAGMMLLSGLGGFNVLRRRQRQA